MQTCKICTVQFSGSAREYNYNVDGLEPQPGDRIVVPHKLKDDGTLSLTIATVVSPVREASAEGLLPALVLIPRALIEHATQLMKEAANG